MQIIFISGASGSGKTTLATELLKTLSSQRVSTTLMSMDNYSCECSDDITDMAAYRRETNFDRLEMYDFALLNTHLHSLVSGECILMPQFDFLTNKRVSYLSIEPSDCLIIEGLFALNFAKMHAADLAKICVYIGPSSYLSLLKTRSDRDVRERGLSLEESRVRERRFVGPAFFSTIAKAKTGVDLDITNDPGVDEDFFQIQQGVNQIMDVLGLRMERSFK